MCRESKTSNAFFSSFILPFPFSVGFAHYQMSCAQILCSCRICEQKRNADKRQRSCSARTDTAPVRKRGSSNLTDWIERTFSFRLFEIVSL